MELFVEDESDAHGEKEVLLDIKGRNDHIAQHVKEQLEERHIFAVNIMGAPGTGKTTSLET